MKLMKVNESGNTNLSIIYFWYSTWYKMSVFLLKTAEMTDIVPYKQRVTGSNPVVPTLKINHLQGFNRVSGFFICTPFDTQGVDFLL